MIKKRRRGLYERKSKPLAFFVALACILCSICGGALCASVGEATPAEDNYNSMETSKLSEEAKISETSPFPMETKVANVDAPATSELRPTEVVKETSPVEAAGSTEPSETQGEVVIALAANSGSRYPGLIVTQDDMELLLGIIWLEARGEPFEGMQGVVEVTFNRVINEKYFPDAIRDVIFDTEIAVQYPTAYKLSEADPTEGQRKLYTEAIEKALNGPYVIPIEVVFFAVEPENSNIWGKIGNHYFCYPWYP